MNSFLKENFSFYKPIVSGFISGFISNLLISSKINDNKLANEIHSDYLSNSIDNVQDHKSKNDPLENISTHCATYNLYTFVLQMIMTSGLIENFQDETNAKSYRYFFLRINGS